MSLQDPAGYPMNQHSTAAYPAPAPTYQSAPMHTSGGLAPMSGAGVAVASGRLFKHRNPVMTWLVFPVITLGIYQLVWYYKIHKEMAEFDRRRQTPVTGPVLVLIFLFWTVIAPLVSFYNTGQRIHDAQRSAGLVPTCSPALACLLAFVFGLNTFYMQAELSKIVDHYGGAPEGTVVPLFV